MLNTTSYRLLPPWLQSGNSLARIATHTTSSTSTVASREKANSKLNLTKRTKEDKHVIYSMPIEEQFETLSKNKEGYEVSRHILKDKKQIDIIDDEIGYITLHIHTSLNNSKVSDAMEMAAAVRKCATFIEEKIGKHIDVTTMAYNRLMNHIRHMVSRAATGEKLKVDLNQFIEKNYPESFALAGEICKELGKDLNHEFLDNETGYLAIHIEQIKCDEMVSE